MIGIGIDTGGTCTDAVIYDLDSTEILASAKTLTTKEDLKIGIENVLQKMPQDLLDQCRQIALSTTLATNACVEDKGGHGKLILIGVNEKVFNETHDSYGIKNTEEVMLVPCKITQDPETCTPPDWEMFRRDLPAFLADCDCVSIVQLFSADYHGAYEKHAAKIIQDVCDIPVILGNTLFPDRNAIRRGSGALLNARLIPVLHDFLIAIKEVFSRRNMNLPIAIIRSDGSQMSEKFASGRPVETLLCGPAASVIGAAELSSVEDAMIVDIGGTTTDISLMKKGLPKRAKNGIRVGAWKTFVKGLYVDTFGLGGDTAVHYDFGGKLYLENYRVIPLCNLAAQYPQVTKELKKLSDEWRFHTYYLHEFFVLMKEPSANHVYSPEALKLCEALRNGPLSMEQAAEAMGKDIYTMHIEELEKDGVIMRAGLTPTDIMHIRGEYTAFDVEASRHAAEFVVRSATPETLEDLCEEIYDLIEKRLYENILRILITSEFPEFYEKDPDQQLQELIEVNYRMAKQGEEADAFFSPSFRLHAKLIGVGAPTHIFLPRVAKLLHTEAVIPEYASVANAVGAIAGKVVAVTTVEIKPAPMGEIDGCEVNTQNSRRVFETYEGALEYAKQEGAAIAEEHVREQGAAGKIAITYDIERNEAKIDLGSTMWMSDLLTVTATGNPGL
ncbi:MAG: hydantoinase/oxoprolinase family protein [Eubacterium sp.]|nr:hydantoinase/oxoprolinase family protein [Eubacterium sp.]